MQEEHDIQANRSVAKVLILGSGVSLFVILLGYLGVARTPLPILWKDFGLAALLMALPFIYLKVKGQAGEWFKYVTLICTIGAVIVLYSDFEISRFVATALLIPLIVAAIYYDPRLTVVAGVITIALANVMDVANGSTIFTPVDFVNGHNVIMIESPNILEDLLFQDMGFVVVIVGFAALAARSRKVFNGLLKAEDRVRQAANHDPLTGLPGFTIFKRKMRQGLARADTTGTKMAVMVIGIGRLHDIRQTLGHGAANKVTTISGTRITESLRKGSTVSKLEGDEFAVVVPDMANESEAISCAQRIIDELETPVDIKGSQAVVDTYIGISIFPDTSNNAPIMVRQAQSAMLKARSDRESAYHIFDLAADEKNRRSSDMEIDLRKAITNDELVVFLQPKVDTKTGTIKAAEALVRWIKPGDEMVSPGEFIPLAERTGLIVDIDTLVMQAACKQVMELHKMGHPITVSVNVSYKDFATTDLLATVKQALADSGLPPEHLELEITESAAMSDVEKVRTDLDAITALGVKAAIDDFGTGYSSLSYMKHFPISTIKIDQSFIRGIGVSRTDEAIITMTTDMAHHLGLHVVAEGVETEDQLKFIRAREIDEIQGFYFYRPMPINELIEVLSPSEEPEEEETEADSIPA